MSRPQFFNKKLILSIVVGLLAVQWAGLTHAHDSNVDIDPICATCLAGENQSHGVIPSKPLLNLNGVFVDQPKSFKSLHPQVNLSHYHSRAPPH